MNRLKGRLVWLWLALAFPAGVGAQDWSLAEADWWGMTLGVVSGIAAHEAGHLVVAKSRGYRVSHEGLAITYPGVDFTPSGQLQLASAGYQTQWVLAELALRDGSWQERESPPGDFGAGVVLSEIGVSIAYLSFLKHQYNGDIYGISNATGMSHDRAALALAIPAMLDAWRLFGTDVPRWVPQLSVMSKGAGMAWVWSY